MSTPNATTPAANSAAPAVDTVWFTRCPVPTATGLAYRLGWLDEEFARDGIQLKTLQETGGELARHHYDHELTTLVREGGNLLAIPARAQGAPTRLVGLTWIDEFQAILVRPDSDISRPEHLRGKRLALPAFRPADIAQNRRGRSIARGMSLQGYKGALNSVGLSLDDAHLVELPPAPPREGDLGHLAGSAGSPTSPRLPGSPASAAAAANGTAGAPPRQDLGTGLWEGIHPLLRGEVDAVYVKGAAALEAAIRLGAKVGIDLDQLPEKRFRVNNGTPRPITVHQSLIDDHFDLLVRFLTQTLRAAEWAKTHLTETLEILQGETRAGSAGVSGAYRNDFHLSLAPDLSEERVELFRLQKNFQLTHGFLDRDFDFDAWIDPRPLEEARRRLAESLASGDTDASTAATLRAAA
ncbi:ABC transporter substrate-binding protein [Mitsuaria sp. 7]|uniref:ABC transporter substrate-binding protein n=1 Tax=Mitsuaria sp. 7 TaxID=1658665 RepID=UPI0007DCBE66|nr:ABC transporter substrate-binding protein [Mitsuaria sp. 7]ANH67769.1 monooxygenase [Mitsuaria sp. 7]